MVKVGEIYPSNNCGEFEIIKYINYKKVKVRFIETGYTSYTRSDSIVSGYIKDPYFPSIYDRAFIGRGCYKSSVRGKNTEHYDRWRNMLRRCYDDHFHQAYPTYKNCEVCDDWLNFQNFSLWWDTNKPAVSVKDVEWCLDKDLKHTRGSKIYSSQTCCIITPMLNLFIRENDTRKGVYKTGVYKPKTYKTFRAFCSNPFTGKSENLGTFPTEDLAHEAYKQRKWELAQQLAELPENAHVSEYILAKYKID